VKSNAARVMGLIFGMNLLSYQALPFALISKSGLTGPEEGDTEIDQDALGNLPEGHFHYRPFESKEGRQDGNEI